MKKLLSYSTIIMLVATIVLTSCGHKAETEEEVPLKITYSIDCSEDLLELCDLIVTYKGDDGANVVDTITAAPADSTGRHVWTKVVGTHKIPVKIGLDPVLQLKSDTSFTIGHPTAWLDAKCTIIAEKIGIKTRNVRISEKIINSKSNFFMDYCIINEKVNNIRRDLANTVGAYNNRQDLNRENTSSNTCFVIKQNPYGDGLVVNQANWND